MHPAGRLSDDMKSLLAQQIEADFKELQEQVADIHGNLGNLNAWANNTSKRVTEIENVLSTETFGDLEERVARLEKVHTERLDMHTERLALLEADVANIENWCGIHEADKELDEDGFEIPRTPLNDLGRED